MADCKPTVSSGYFEKNNSPPSALYLPRSEKRVIRFATLLLRFLTLAFERREEGEIASQLRVRGCLPLLEPT